MAEGAQDVVWARLAMIRAEAFAAAVQKGVWIVEPSADDIAQWRACSAGLLDAFMARAGQAGRKLFEVYGKLRTERCCRDGRVCSPPGWLDLPTLSGIVPETDSVGPLVSVSQVGGRWAERTKPNRSFSFLSVAFWSCVP
jgi:hypothetical protein